MFPCQPYLWLRIYNALCLCGDLGSVSSGNRQKIQKSNKNSRKKFAYYFSRFTHAVTCQQNQPARRERVSKVEGGGGYPWMISSCKLDGAGYVVIGCQHLFGQPLSLYRYFFSFSSTKKRKIKIKTTFFYLYLRDTFFLWLSWRARGWQVSIQYSSTRDLMEGEREKGDRKS